MTKHSQPIWIFFGIIFVAIIVILLSLLIYPNWLTIPQGIITLILQVLLGSVGIFSDLITILGYFRDKSAPSSNLNLSSVDHSQTIAGHNNRQVQMNGGTYIEKATLHPQAESPVMPEPSINVIPSSTSEKYILRGPEISIKNILLGQNGVPIALVHGPHGMGKSELAIHISHEIKGNFENTYWINLGNRPLAQVMNDFLRQCSLKIPDALSDQVQVLQAHLAHHHFLVILDDLCTPQIEDLQHLLPPASCSTLITSCIQQPSHLISLSHSFPLERMDEKKGKELFEAALGADPVQAEAQAVTNLIERCAGNPLALEISARRIRQMRGTPHPISTYLARLQKSLNELKVGRESRMDLFAVFDQTYDFLPKGEQDCFRKLSVFAPAGFSPAAAMAIWGLDEPHADEVIQDLLNLNFLKPVAAENDRYQLHDLLLEYAARKLSPEEQTEAYHCLTHWLIELFSDHVTMDISTAPEVGLELDNLRRAASWAMQRQDGQSLAHLATAPRNWLLIYFQNLDEWQVWLQTALDLGISEKQSKANTLMAIGDVQHFKKQTNAALRSYQDALTLFRSVGDHLGEANTLWAIGDVQQFKKQTDAALLSYQDALALFRSVGSYLGEANTLSAIGSVQYFKAQNEDALLSYQDALALFRSIGSHLGEANTLLSIGVVLHFKAQDDDALHCYQGALALFRSIGLHIGEANTLWAIGNVQRFKEQTEDALRSYQDALTLFRSAGEQVGEANTLAAQSQLLVQEGKLTEAEKKLQEAIALRRQIQDLYNEGADNCNFARALLEQKEYAKAAEYVQKARSLFQAIPLPGHVERMDQHLAKIKRLAQNDQVAKE